MSLSLEERVAKLEAAVEALRPVDISGDQYADFVVRKSPSKWLESGGIDYAGKNISQTSPEFCEALASFLDWQASKDEEKNYSYVNGKGEKVFPAKYARKDAGRARAFAAKMRSKTAPSSVARVGASGDSRIRQPVQTNLGPQEDDPIPF